MYAFERKEGDNRSWEEIADEEDKRGIRELSERLSALMDTIEDHQVQILALTGEAQYLKTNIEEIRSGMFLRNTALPKERKDSPDLTNSHPIFSSD